MSPLTEAKAGDGFRVALRFDDGTRGVADLSDLADRGVPRVVCSVPVHRTLGAA
jgi:hypothetical protein